MPNDYSLVREKRKGPKIEMGKGMHRVETPEPKKDKAIIPFSDKNPAANDPMVKNPFVKGGGGFDYLEPQTTKI